MPFPDNSSDNQILKGLMKSTSKICLFVLVAIAVIACTASFSIRNTPPDNEEISAQQGNATGASNLPPINNDLLADGYLIDTQDRHFNIYKKDSEPWTYFELFDKNMNPISSESTKHIYITYLTDDIISIYNSGGSPSSLYKFYYIESNELTEYYQQAYLLNDRFLAFPSEQGDTYYLNVINVFNDSEKYKFAIDYDCYSCIFRLTATFELVDGIVFCNHISGDDRSDQQISFPLISSNPYTDKSETEPEEESSAPEQESDAHTYNGRELVLSKISRDEAGLTTYPTHSLNGYRPDEEWLNIADGSTPYTDEHFATGIRHAREYPFMRSAQRDMVLFLPAYGEPVIADIRVGDSIGDVAEKLGQPTLEYFEKLDASLQGDAAYEYPDENFPTFRFMHYKGDDFYITFMGADTIKMIGVKRLPTVDYPLDLLETWQGTLLSHGKDATLESRDNFFDSLNYYNWIGGLSVSNKGLKLWDGHDTTLTVYNDYQGYLYAEKYADDGTWLDPDGVAEGRIMNYPFTGEVHLVNRDSNMDALTTYMSGFHMLERQLAAWPNTSQGGKYIVMSESLRPYNYYYILRDTSGQHRDILFHNAPAGFLWLDDYRFLTYSNIYNGITMRHISYTDWESENIYQQLEIDGGPFSLMLLDGDRVVADCGEKEEQFRWGYDSDWHVYFHLEDGSKSYKPVPGVP